MMGVETTRGAARRPASSAAGSFKAGLFTAGAFFLLGALFFAGLGKSDLCGSDEPRVAGVIAAMARSGDLVVPRLAGDPFLEKPPLFFWAGAAAFRVFGETPFAARLPAALAGLLGVLATLLLARAMGSSLPGALLSGFFLATAAEYWEISRQCLTDMTLCFFITCAMAFFYVALRSGRPKVLPAALAVLSMAAAVMTKGLVGLAVPLAALCAWLVLRRDFSLRSWSFLAASSLLCLVPAAAWLFFLNRDLGFDAVHTAAWTNNFGRFTGSLPHHAKPFYFYVTRFPLQFLPWTLFLPLAALRFIRDSRVGERDEGSLFLAAWFAAPFVLLSIATDKRGMYLLPLYPAAALLAGRAVEGVLAAPAALLAGRSADGVLAAPAVLLGGRGGEGVRTPPPPAAKWFLIPQGLLCAAAPLAAAALFGAGVRFELSLPACLLVSLPGLFFGILALRRFLRRDGAGSLAFLLASAAALLIAVQLGLYPLVNRADSYKPLFARIAERESAGDRIAFYKPREALRGAAVLYLKKERIEVLRTPAALNTYLASDEKRIALADERNIKDLPGLDRVEAFPIGRRTYVLLGDARQSTRTFRSE